MPPESRLFFSVDTWTRQLAHFIEANMAGQGQGGAPAEPVYVVGNSLGGYLAVSLAAARPDLVKGLVLLNATPFWGEPACPARAGRRGGGGRGHALGLGLSVQGGVGVLGWGWAEEVKGVDGTWYVVGPAAGGGMRWV